MSAFDVPDLDLPAPPPAQPKTHARPKSSPGKLELGLDVSGKGAPSELPAAFQQPSPPGLEDDDESNTSGLELATAPVRPASIRPAPAHPSREDLPRGMSSGRVSVPPPPGRRASIPPPGATSSPDLYEVQQVAHFGPAPEFPWESVVYTLRVFSRLRELRQEIARATEEQRAQEKAADDAVVQFLDHAYTELIQDGSFARMFEPVQEMIARKRSREANHRKALLEAALTAYDPKKVKEGALYLGGALLLLLGGVILGILRMNQELSAPPPVLPPE